MINKIQKERIEFSPTFIKRITHAPIEIKIAFREALELFLEDPNHEALRNHYLTKQYAGVQSIDVTDDWRALYRKEDARIVFLELGTHKQLYG